MMRLLLALVEHTKSVEDEVGIAECLDSHWKLLFCLLEFKCSAGDLNNSLKAKVTTLSATSRIHNPTIVEVDLALEFFVAER
jgi:hypothetical protein